MFKTIVKTLDSLGHSPEREGQQETDSGCTYEDNSPFVWYFDGSLWRCRPEGQNAIVEVFHDGNWIKNSLIQHQEQAVEFAEELAATVLMEVSMKEYPLNDDDLAEFGRRLVRGEACCIPIRRDIELLNGDIATNCLTWGSLACYHIEKVQQVRGVLYYGRAKP